MNPILLITYNNLYYTKMAVDSALAQDVPIELVIVNNGSSDGTRQWVSDLSTLCGNVTAIHMDRNESPIKIVNNLLPTLFANSDHVLGMPNDAKIPPNCYSEMLKWPRGFVCATDIGQNDPEIRPAKAVSENTPMAVMMVRKWAYEALIAKDGYFFDEGYFHYGSDCDLAVRMAACGIRGIQLDLPYYHFGSATLNKAHPYDRRCMEIQADEDRAYFERKWGFSLNSIEYGQRPADLNFKAECAKVTQSSLQGTR